MTWWGWTYLIGCVIGGFMLIASIGRRRNPVTAGEAILQIILQAALVAGNYYVGMRL